MRRPSGVLAILLAGGLSCSAAWADANAADALEALLLYRGDWAVTAEHSWNGAVAASVDRLHSSCERFSAYITCEQSVKDVHGADRL